MTVFAVKSSAKTLSINNMMSDEVMKVLFINSVCGIRSTGRIVSDLADRYMSQGHEVKIAYGREAAAEKYAHISYRIGTDADVKINALKARLLDNDGFNALRQTKKFIEFANDYNPDVLWLHNLHGYYINIDLLFDWIKQRPEMKVMWTLHDCWSLTGHCAHFDYAKCSRWKDGCGSCPQKNVYPASWILDRSRENHRRKKEAFCGVEDLTLIVPSAWLARLVKQSFLKEYPVDVVRNTVDTEIFRPAEGDFRKQTGLEDKKIVLGVASAWSDRKGLSDFIKLSDMLPSDYKIVLVGLTKKQTEKMPENIFCMERTNSARELAQIYTQADVFVNLTYEDTYPTVNLESQACGTVCLTYRTGGSPESVPPENVVEQGDLKAMAKRIEEICKTEKL